MSLTGKVFAAVLLAAGVGYLVADPDPATADRPRNVAQATASLDIPSDYLAFYHQSGAICPSVDWALLAGIGHTETDHGRSTLPGVHSGMNPRKARGPMQFVDATWATMRTRHSDIESNVYDPAAAIPAAAHLLCDETARLGSVEKAIYAYNHDPDYVSTVLAQARTYRREAK